MRRRRFLGSAVGLGAAVTTGCLGLLETREAGLPSVPEDRPEAIYYPSHTESMRVIGTDTAGDFGVALTYSFPHRFWTVTGDRTTRIGVADADDIHLMATLFDPETRRVLPVGSGATVRVTGPDGTAYDRAPWAMLSQRMSFHYGDNVSLDGPGTYEVTIETGAISIPRTGAFADRFGESRSVSMSWEFDPATVESIDYETVGRAGQRGAVPLMEMNAVPLAQVPPSNALGGQLSGAGRSGSATVAAAVFGPESRFGREPYLVVSPRTRYNRVPLPLASLQASVARNGELIENTRLSASLDSELGYVYGTPVSTLEAGDTVTVSWETPPQAARHEGYETALLTMPATTFTLS